MRMILVVIAASVLGADRPKSAESPTLQYQVNVLEMDGLSWRSSLQTQLQSVAHQGAATVWVASRESARAIAEKAARIVSAPRLRCLPQVLGTITQNSTRKLVTEVGREADQPMHQVALAGVVPRVEEATVGYSCEVKGRAIDQGILTQLTFEDRQITAVHLVPLNQVVELSSKSNDQSIPVNALIQVPEYARISVGGEWLIPEQGALIISLGAHTISDAKGKAVVRERLAVIEADTLEIQEDVNLKAEALEIHRGMVSFSSGPFTVQGMNSLVSISRLPKEEIPLPIAQPVLPSLSLPQPIDASGLPLALPPLPDDEAPLTRLPGSMVPCPSPQARPSAIAAGEPTPWKKSRLRDTPPASDLEAERTGYKIEPPLCECEGTAECPACETNPPAVPTLKKPALEKYYNELYKASAPATESTTKPGVGNDPKTSSRTKSYRFTVPLNGMMKMEVNVRVNARRPADPN